MESVFGRYRNISILVGVLFLQVLGLAVQVKRNTDNKPTRLLRVWTVSAVSPFEKAIVWVQSGSSHLWHDYLYLRGVRQENRDLKAQIERLRLQEVRLKEDAEQARRLQVLLGFKEQYISQTLAAQVIGSCGSAQSRCVYLDKGTKDGLSPDMAVITADGIVGKVLRTFSSTAQVLLIDDQTSGVGAILEKSRLQGILRGTASGDVVLEKVMSDEQVQPGENVLTSGGDLVFPKGMPVGTVVSVDKGSESFLNIRLKPAANLAKLEEVLVITKKESKTPALADTGSARAVDILAQRLPSVPQQPATDPNAPPPPTNNLKITPAPASPAGSATGTNNSTVTVKPSQGIAGPVKPGTGTGLGTASQPKTAAPGATPAGVQSALPKPATPSQANSSVPAARTATSKSVNSNPTPGSEASPQKNVVNSAGSSQNPQVSPAQPVAPKPQPITPPSPSEDKPH